MEFSSPLAALRPQPYQSWAFGKDVPMSRPMYGGYVNFDFRNMSMHQKPPRQDYFTMRPVRGTSPTATLTADLSANFHIDER
jgi:M-phase inducer tyrosine phosphatase